MVRPVIITPIWQGISNKHPKIWENSNLPSTVSDVLWLPQADKTPYFNVQISCKLMRTSGTFLPIHICR
jgi:hypothetical protein